MTIPLPRVIAIEVTRRCNLRCIHCRIIEGDDPVDELSTDELEKLLDEIASRVKPVVILTGGEPLMRDDIFEIARYGTALGCRMVMAPNGTLLDDDVARKLVDAGIKRVSISIDGATAEVHDEFRSMPGAFVGAMKGIEAAREAGLPFQINTSVTAFNVDELPKIHDMARELGAAAHHIFMLVRVGRGRELDAEVPPRRQEKVLNWLRERQLEGRMEVRATCAPHFVRISMQRAADDDPDVRRSRGCLAGRGFVFISSTGRVQPCGYFDVDCGNIRDDGFWRIWEKSSVMNDLRDDDLLRGKCGRCQYRAYCGGCRARALSATGDYLDTDQACLYKPPDAND